MEELMIRRAEAADAAAICRICCESLGYLCTPDFVTQRLNGQDSEREVIFVAVCGGVGAGFVHAEVYKVLYAEDMINLLGLAVSGDCQRQGVGTRLLQEAEMWALSHGITKMRVNSGGERDTAHSFYRRFGFSREKVQLTFYKDLI